MNILKSPLNFITHLGDMVAPRTERQRRVGALTALILLIGLITAYIIFI